MIPLQPQCKALRKRNKGNHQLRILRKRLHIVSHIVSHTVSQIVSRIVSRIVSHIVSRIVLNPAGFSGFKVD